MLSCSGKNKVIKFALFHFLIASLSLCLSSSLIGCNDVSSSGPSYLKLPPGFKMELVASNLEGVKTMVFNEDGSRMWVNSGRKGIIFLFEDTDGDGKFDDTTTYLEGLREPDGLAFHNGALYVAEPHRVIVTYDENNDGRADNVSSFVWELPEGGAHRGRTINFGPDGRLYVGIGSSCNLCEEDDPRRAAIISFDKDGKDMKIFASGLRNPAGFAWNNKTKKMWCTESSRNFFRPDFPNDEINIIEEGKNYGWPYCFSSKEPDLDYKKSTLDISEDSRLNEDLETYCKKTQDPVFLLEAQSKPKGMVFYTGGNFPKKYRNNIFVALNDAIDKVRFPKGCKVIRLVMDGDKVVKSEDFITGWFVSPEPGELEGTVRGAPYALTVAPDGSLYVSDNIGGFVYRVYWSGDSK